MNANDKNVSDEALHGWVPHEKGYEMTRCGQIIANRLIELKRRKLPVVLVHEKYQSGNSLLLDVTEQLLLIDKPLDWPNSFDSIRIIFRDPNKLWNHFYSKIVKADSDTLYATVPTHFFMLQRREHYRVETPPGSVAAFLHKKDYYNDIAILDLSAGGMQLVAQKGNQLQAGATLEEVLLTIPLQNETYPATVLCAKADIVRATEDAQNRRLVLGVKFRASSQEEAAIIRYVRQRELELLRKTSGEDP